LNLIYGSGLRLSDMYNGHIESHKPVCLHITIDTRTAARNQRLFEFTGFRACFGGDYITETKTQLLG